MIKPLIFFLISLLLSACGDHKINLGNNYFFLFESKENAIIYREPWQENNPLIYCSVDEYDFDDDHIIAKQVYSSECFWPVDKPVIPMINEKFYWIIDKKKNIYLGPYHYKEFSNQLDSLDIELKLN